MYMKRVYNFSAGPSVLPEPVLRRAADEMLDYQGSGQSVMEMSHRSKAVSYTHLKARRRKLSASVYPFQQSQRVILSVKR